MGFIYTITASLALWLILWALGTKSVDAFLVAIVIMLLGVTVRMLAPRARRS